jgi:AmmeMemoRadiSam system protein A
MYPLTEFTQKEILTLARRSVRDFLQTGKKNIQISKNLELQIRAGVFVTLRNGEKLRGCIGIITPPRPLFETVQECAISAATSDPRFNPVTLSELEEIRIEISLLSAPEPLKDLSQIELGNHGLIISQEGKRGLLLPQVATENHWDRETFLAQTCRKGGLPMDAWQRGAEIMSFRAFVFAEK